MDFYFCYLSILSKGLLQERELALLSLTGLLELILSKMKSEANVCLFDQTPVHFML